jgi:growth arrest-specific protein 7
MSMADVQLVNQEATSKFSEELMGAFPAVVTKTEVGLQVVKDMAEFYRNRAKIEDEYAKKLAALYKAPPGAGFFSKDPAVTKEYKSLKESLLAILDKGNKISNSHQDFANKINNDICKVLDNWVKNKTLERSKFLGEGQKHLKSVADAKAAVQKHKAEYEKLMKAADVAKEQLMKAEKDEINQPDNKKLPPITKKASTNFIQSKDKAKQQEQTYQAAVKKANEETESNRKERVPAVLESAQKWDEDRWNTLLASVKQLRTLQDAVPAVLEVQSKELTDIYENANIEADFREFIDANKKGSEADESFEFVAYKSKYEDEEEKKEPAPAVTQPPSDFSTKTAEEKLQAEPEKTEEQKKQEREALEAKKEADRKKTADIKSNLFGSAEDENDSIFK